MLKATVTKNGLIALPKTLKAKFSPNEDLIVEVGSDTLLLKRAKTLTLTEIAKRLAPSGKKISPKEIIEEISAYRRKT